MNCLFRHGLYAAAFAALSAGAQPSATSAITPAATQPQAPAASPAPAAPAAQAARRPDPTDASVAVPATPHRTALTGYRRLTDEPPRAWRESNDNVTRIGGWRTYLREAQTPDPKASEVAR